MYIHSEGLLIFVAFLFFWCIYDWIRDFCVTLFMRSVLWYILPFVYCMCCMITRFISMAISFWVKHGSLLVFAKPYEFWLNWFATWYLVLISIRKHMICLLVMYTLTLKYVHHFFFRIYMFSSCIISFFKCLLFNYEICGLLWLFVWTCALMNYWWIELMSYWRCVIWRCVIWICMI